MSTDETDRASTALAFVLAALALGLAVEVNDGTLAPRAMLYLNAALLLCLVALALPSSARLDQLARRALPWTLALVLVVFAYPLAARRPTLYVLLLFDRAADTRVGVPLLVLVLAAALTIAWIWRRRPAVLGLVALLLWTALAVFVLSLSPGPPIDVLVLHRQAIADLLHGHDPYATVIPNIYGHVDYYPSGFADEKWVRIGFMYPALPLVLATLGQLVTGDFRLGYLAAVALGCGLMLAARPTRRALAALLVFLIMPRAFFVLERGWTEPVALLGLGATLFAVERRPSWLPWCYGLLLASKQYFVTTVTAAACFFRRGSGVRPVAVVVAKAAALAALTMLPFLIWNPRALVRSTLLVQLHAPFRADSLSELAFFSTGYTGSAVGFLFEALVALACLRRLPRTPSGFAGSLSLMLLVFFAFNRQAFCNYYYFVIASLCASVAFARLDGPKDDRVLS